jgi:hypothetical protein
MREYLFRGKRNDNGKWAYGYYMVIGDRHLIINPKIPESNPTVIPETIGQFTGVLAKNGKKIFEHDIVEFGGGHGYPKWKPKQVVWGNTLDVALSTCCGFMLDGTQMFLSTDDSDSIKYIGNIHDNPELLEFPVHRLCRNCVEYRSCKQKKEGKTDCNKHRFPVEKNK